MSNQTKKLISFKDILNLNNKILCDTSPDYFFESDNLAIYIENNTDFELEDFNEVYFQIKESEMDVNKSRWYQTSTSVFQFDGGFLGVTGVSETYSEMTSFEDIGKTFEFLEYEEYSTVSYKVKSK